MFRTFFAPHGIIGRITHIAIPPVCLSSAPHGFLQGRRHGCKGGRDNFLTPTLRLPDYDYGCTKFAHRNWIMILKKSEKSFVKVIVMTDDVIMCSFVSLH